MTKTHVSQMTEAEAAAKLAELKRGPPPEPVELETAKTAREMTEVERQSWLLAHKRRHS